MQTKSNPAIIGAVRSISGTNVSVQLYPSLNSTISYIYGNGYKVGQVGGFVKIPQGFVNCKHSNKCTFYSLRFGCSFAVANTIKPQLL